MNYMKPEKIEPVEGVNAMRKELLRMRRYDNLIRAVMDMADCHGLSAEDRYVILAYNALRDRERLTEIVLDDLVTRPRFFFEPPKL